VAGGALGAAVINGSASAQTDTSTTTTPASSSSTPAAPATPNQGAAQRDPSKGGHIANGITEVVLTGDAASKATAAAQAAVPDARIERVENDAEGAVYEAHLVKADGSHVTVKLDANFRVTGIEDGYK
jgi:uncharacterized membrane protein YkoI